jgi:glucan phosphoethanolaminetransferase (alkaline phosphatase superfamily)
MQQETNVSFGIKWGVLIGVVYSVLLLLRYTTGATNPIMLGLWAFVGYLAVLILLLISGFQLRKRNGGFIELKEVFKILFLSVLIFELFYALFNFIYLKYVNPTFFQTLKDSTEALLQKSNQPQEKIDEMLEKMDAQAAANMNILDVLKSYLVSISISGVFALIFSLIIKKKKDPFLNQQDNFLQS